MNSELKKGYPKMNLQKKSMSHDKRYFVGKREFHIVKDTTPKPTLKLLSNIINFGCILMNYIKSCEFNIDTACVEVKFIDGTMVSIDCDAVEAEYARNMYEASALDFLIYNEPLSYVELLLSGEIEDYLRNNTDYTPLSDMR